MNFVHIIVFRDDLVNFLFCCWSSLVFSVSVFLSFIQNYEFVFINLYMISCFGVALRLSHTISKGNGIGTNKFFLLPPVHSSRRTTPPKPGASWATRLFAKDTCVYTTWGS